MMTEKMILRKKDKENIEKHKGHRLNKRAYL